MDDLLSQTQNFDIYRGNGMGVKHRIKIIALSFSLLSSLGVEADIINFDSLAPGDTVASLNGVTF